MKIDFSVVIKDPDGDAVKTARKAANNNRAHINTNGSTTWTAIATAA
jgi:hypothetical protein